MLAIQTWSGDWLIGQQAYNAPGWSICVEIFLYALFPFLVPVIAAMLARATGPSACVVVIGDRRGRSSWSWSRSSPPRAWAVLHGEGAELGPPLAATGTP